MSVALLAPAAAAARHARSFVVLGDNPLVVEALVARIRAVWPTATIAYAGSSVRDAVRRSEEVGCDCAVVDVDRGDGVSGPEIVSGFAMHGVRTVVLTDRATPQELEACRTSGASGYVDKRADVHAITQAIDATLDGRTWTSDRMQRARTSRGSTVELSPQEQRALVLYSSGLTQDMVARRMGIAASTVKHYLDRVREKYAAAGIAARTKIELHARAREDGFLG